ncbi:unnamed protein product [Mortierella alpina]
MSLNTILRALRVTVILLTLAISGNNVYLPPSTFSDHVNTLLAPTFAIVYAVTLCAKVRLIGPYLRAALLILPALLWYSTSMSRPDNRHSNMRERMIRMDTLLSFPTSIMIVLECILTLRWEARRKLLVEAAKSGPPHEQRQQQQHPSSRQDQELSTMIVIDNRALIPTILPPEEQDNVELVIPVASTPVIQNRQSSGGSGHLVGSCLVQMPEKVQYAPTRAYFPPASSSASSSSHREQQRHQRQQRQQRLQRQSDEVRLEEASDDCLPPYTR